MFKFRSWGWLLLAIWLIVYGIIGLFSVTFQYQGQIMAALALVAGVLLLLDR